MPSEADRVLRRLSSAFGGLYDTLVDEAPERSAWLTLGMSEVEAAMDRARLRMDDPGIALGFRTLLKQELDNVCDLSPAIQPFEASSLPAERALRQRIVRHDERSREQERAVELRRNELRDQARALLRREEP